MVSLVGCSSKSSAEKKPSSSVGQKPKAPAELKSIATELDMLIAELDKKFKMQNMPAMQQNIQLNPQGKSQGGQSQGAQSQGGQSQKQATDWQKEFSSLKTIHTNWNNLMPEAVQAGMSIDSRNQFSKALEQLTQDISKQKLEDSLSAVLMVYKNYADLNQIFTSSVPAEFYQVKYETMTAIFESSRKNWTAAGEHVPKFKEHWVYFSAQAKEADPKILSRTEFAVLDLEQAIKSKQMELVMIKGEITMTNLKSLEEKLSSQPSGQGQ
jgi:hypothetical protein